MSEKWYCGCCGGDLPEQTAIWCNKCLHHVLHRRRGCTPGFGMEDRTWFAQTGEDCPFKETP